MIKAIAIDDEPISLNILATYCNVFDFIELKGTFTNLEKAKRYINKNEVDVMFLDVEMPSGNGIEFFKSLNKDPKIILITAHSKYAIEGFNINALDYLLKPFSLERFEKSLKRIQKQIELENDSVKENTHLSIKADYKLYNILLDSIERIEAMDDYIKIIISDNSPVVARYTMKGILNKLPKEQFVRVHKSHIVPINKITSVGSQSLELQNDTIPIGNAYKSNLGDIFS